MSDALAELTISDFPTASGDAVSITWLQGEPGHAVARAWTSSGQEIVLDVFAASDPPRPGEAQIVQLLRLVAEAFP